MDASNSLDHPYTAAIIGVTGSPSPSGPTISSNASGSLPPPQFYEKDPAAVSDELRTTILPQYSIRLQALFDSDPWVQQNQPLNVVLVKALLHKVGTKPSLFECPFQLGGCIEKDDHATKATEHIEEHLGHRGFACDICNLTFRRAYERDRHRDRHNPGAPIKCPECQASFVDAKNLSRHIRENCPSNRA